MTHPSSALQEVNPLSPLLVKRKLSRRTLLQNLAGLALIGSLTLLVTACGFTLGTSPASNPSPTPLQTVDVNAALHSKTNPYPPYTGQLVLDDPLNHDDGQWPSYAPDVCVYQNGKYILTAMKDNGGYAVCPGGPKITGDFTIQFKATFVYQSYIHPTPNDDGAAGIAFGRTANGFDYFLILINQQGKLTVSGVGPNIIGEGQLAAKEIAGFKKDQPILLAVVVQRHQASIYVNFVKELTVTIPTLGQGRISLEVDWGSYSYVASAAFQNARLWM
jgi:hypothetical protein